MFSKSKASAWILLAVTFLLGVAAGGVAMAAWNDDGDNGRREHPRERVSYSDRLQEELALTQAQRESVDVILERREEQMRQLWSNIHPQFDTLRAQVRSEISGILDEEQRATFAEMIAHSDSVRRHRSRGGTRD
jgi:hypothetical protein